ncbi:L-type lectin-domain containing receptor kinase VIII.1-like [Fagus crenata]
MAKLSSPFSLVVVLLFALTLIPNSISYYPLTRSLPNNLDFDSDISIIGDASIVDSYVKLTRPLLWSSGLLMRMEPIKFVVPTSSFSSEFSFSISPGEGGEGLVLALVPTGLGSLAFSNEKRFLGVEFGAGIDGNASDLNSNRVGINVNHSESSVSDVSSLNLVLNKGERLKSWIDYDASSKRLEVRLSKFEDPRPYNPIIAYAIDLAEMWGSEDVQVVITSSNWNSTQVCSVYSWRFRVRNSRTSMHSMPVDPRNFAKERGESVRNKKRSFCLLRMIGGLIFGTACAALVAFVVIFMWMIFSNVRGDAVVKAKSPVYPVDFRYEKLDVVVVEKGSDSLKN